MAIPEKGPGAGAQAKHSASPAPEARSYIQTDFEVCARCTELNRACAFCFWDCIQIHYAGRYVGCVELEQLGIDPLHNGDARETRE